MFNPGDVSVAKAEIFAGVCGFRTTVTARSDEDGMVQLDIQSDCKGVRKLAEQLKEIALTKDA